MVEDEALAERVAEVAGRLAGCQRLGLRSIKRALNAACDAGFEASLSLEQAYDAANYANPETRAGLAAFLEARRRP